MIEKVQIQELRYWRGASDGLPQKTATARLLFTGDVQAWREQIAASDAVARELGSVLPSQGRDTGRATQILFHLQQPVRQEHAFAEAMLALCVAIQREARDAVWSGRVVQVPGLLANQGIRLALPYEREAVLKDALQWAARWLLHWGSATTNRDSTAALLRDYRGWLDAAQAGGLPPNTLRFAISADL